LIIFSQSSSFNLGAKVTGEKFSKLIAVPPEGKPMPKDRKPDWVVEEQTTPEQAIMFRLSGDYNPLHIGMSSSPSTSKHELTKLSIYAVPRP